MSLLKNENLAERLGDPSETSTFKLLYCLQIIQSLLSSNGHKKSGTMSLYFEAARKGYGQQMQDQGPHDKEGQHAERDDLDGSQAAANEKIRRQQSEESKENGEVTRPRPRRRQGILEAEDVQESVRNLAGDHWGGPRGSDDVQEEQGR